MPFFCRCKYLEFFEWSFKSFIVLWFHIAFIVKQLVPWHFSIGYVFQFLCINSVNSLWELFSGLIRNLKSRVGLCIYSFNSCFLVCWCLGQVYWEGKDTQLTSLDQSVEAYHTNCQTYQRSKRALEGSQWDRCCAFCLFCFSIFYWCLSHTNLLFYIIIIMKVDVLFFWSFYP